MNEGHGQILILFRPLVECPFGAFPISMREMAIGLPFTHRVAWTGGRFPFDESMGT